MKVLRIKLFFCLLAILILSNCNQKMDNRELFVDRFPNSQDLNSIRLIEIENSIPSQIVVLDSFLVLLNSMGGNFFSVYDKSNTELIIEFGTEGGGPSEFNSPEFSGQVIQENNDIYHLIYDWKTQQISFLNLKESIRLNEPIFASKKLPNELNDTHKLVNYSDTSIISVPSGVEEIGRFKIFKDSVARIIDFLPKLPFKVNKENLYAIYANVSSAVHPRKNKFVATAVLLGQYDFFDFDGKYLHSTVVDRDANLQVAAVAPVIFDEPIVFYHTQLIASDSLIYSLYTTSTDKKGISKSKIHVLDWEGNPVKEYILDCILMRFDLDLENDAIYGLSYSNDKEEKIDLVKFLLE